MSNLKAYLRFSIAQRAEHWLLVLSFTVLAITGLPQKFAGDGWAETMIAWMGGIETVRTLHHFAAILLLLECVYHGVSLGYKIFVQRVRWSMFPQLQDAIDALNAVLYNLGLRKAPPKYDHFSFAEKAEYWALVWGTIIMALTGFMLWNPIITSRFVSGQVIPAAKAAHGAEAILAVLAILVWHIYNVHLREFNKAMFTGKISAHAMEQEHAAELERSAREPAGRAIEPPLLRRRQRAFLPIALIAALALLLGVFLFTTAETTAVTTVPRRSTVQVFAPQTRTPTRQPTATPKPQIVEATPTGGVAQATPVVQATPTAAAAGIKPLPASHAGRTVCQVCHATGVGGAPHNPPDHAGRLDAACTDCHTPK